MNLLLDTQIFLWVLDDSKKLSVQARDEIQQADTVYVSAASIWEIAIKSGLGKLQVAPGVAHAEISGSGFLELPVKGRHAVIVSSLPMLHRDPFDRLLIAQAITEPLRFLTADRLLLQYSALVHVV